jgi:hypothetical protein
VLIVADALSNDPSACIVEAERPDDHTDPAPAGTKNAAAPASRPNVPEPKGSEDVGEN